MVEEAKGSEEYLNFWPKGLLNFSERRIALVFFFPAQLTTARCLQRISDLVGHFCAHTKKIRTFEG